MFVYRLDLTLHEKVFFASREIDELFQTEPVLGNYALTYALGFCLSPYRQSDREDRPYYREDLGGLNKKGLYVTPGTPVGTPALEVERFNGMVDSYWYKMANNAIVADLAVRLDSIRAPATNFPQKGRLRVLSRGNRFRCYVFSRESVSLPRYIRLGKFMGKIRLEVTQTWQDPPTQDVQAEQVEIFLNPLDLPPTVEVGYHDLFNLPPVPLIINAQLSGRMCYLDDIRIPAGMMFRLPADAPPRRRGRRRARQ